MSDSGYGDWIAWHLVHSVLGGSRSSRISHMVLLHARQTLVRVFDLVFRILAPLMALLLGLIVAFFSVIVSLLDARKSFLPGAPSAAELPLEGLVLLVDFMESVGSNVILVTVGWLCSRMIWVILKCGTLDRLSPGALMFMCSLVSSSSGLIRSLSKTSRRGVFVRVYSVYLALRWIQPLLLLMYIATAVAMSYAV